MDVAHKWNQQDIGNAKNLVRAFKKMNCGNDMLGIEALALAKAIDWLNTWILVMENPPVKMEASTMGIAKEKKQPAKMSSTKKGMK